MQSSPMSSPGASAFLLAVALFPELSLSSAEMSISLQRWLHLPVVQTVPSGPCVCWHSTKPNSLSPDHLLTCPNEDMLACHQDGLRRILSDMALAFGRMIEPRCLPGFGQGRGDLLLHDLHPGQSVIAGVCAVRAHLKKASLT